MSACTTTYFVVFSKTSRNGVAGLDPKIMWVFHNEIIEAAAHELRKTGESLEDLAGIDWLEDDEGNFKPARQLTDDEVLSLSIEKLGDDGRLYQVFSTDQAGAAAFIEAAKSFHLEADALELVERFNK